MPIGELSGTSRRSEVSTSAEPMVSVCRASLILRPGISAISFSAVLDCKSFFETRLAQSLINIEPREQERRVMSGRAVW